MDIKQSFRYRIFCMALCTLTLLCIPACAADTLIARTISPASPVQGETVTVTLSLPPAFFGGVIEQLPEGFMFGGTSHPQNGMRQSGRTVIFAVTDEEQITYTVRVPPAGCGTITGEWENIGSRRSGNIPATVIATAGTDPASCGTGTRQSPGFGLPAAAIACLAAALIVLAWRRIR